ncbi:hypothetical protein PHYBLDRAFT_107153, partial [Phycomyces blakesleeanus NRRL 1555(-)]
FFGQQHEQVNKHDESEHKGSISHEVIAGAAAYEAVKAYNDHCEKEGKPQDHTIAKEILAGFAAGALDKLIETKGLDYLDRQKAKKDAESQVKQYYDEEQLAEKKV